MKTKQCFTHGLCDQLPDFSFPMEFNLAFGRMNVHVHFGRIDFHQQAANRIAPFHERRVIAFQQRVIESAIFHRTAVYEEMLVLARGARNSRRTDKTPEP